MYVRSAEVLFIDEQRFLRISLSYIFIFILFLYILYYIKASLTFQNQWLSFFSAFNSYAMETR